jgi:hypothetical protein
MEFAIRAYEFPNGIPPAGIISEPAQLPEARQRVGFPISGRQLGRRGLQQKPQIEKLLNVPKRDRGNGITMPRRDPCEAFQNQAPEGLTGRGLADPESPGDVSFRQALSRCKSTFNDGETQPEISPLSE